MSKKGKINANKRPSVNQYFDKILDILKNLCLINEKKLYIP